jgi:hypothetical protein
MPRFRTNRKKLRSRFFTMKGDGLEDEVKEAVVEGVKAILPAGVTLDTEQIEEKIEKVEKVVIQDVKAVLPAGATFDTMLSDEQIGDIFGRLKADPRLANFNLDAIKEQVEEQLYAEAMVGGAHYFGQKKQNTKRARKEAARKRKEAEREQVRMKQLVEGISEARWQPTEGQMAEVRNAFPIYERKERRQKFLNTHRGSEFIHPRYYNVLASADPANLYRPLPKLVKTQKKGRREVYRGTSYRKTGNFLAFLIILLMASTASAVGVGEQAMVSVSPTATPTPLASALAATTGKTTAGTGIRIAGATSVSSAGNTPPSGKVGFTYGGKTFYVNSGSVVAARAATASPAVSSPAAAVAAAASKSVTASPAVSSPAARVAAGAGAVSPSPTGTVSRSATSSKSSSVAASPLAATASPSPTGTVSRSASASRSVGAGAGTASPSPIASASIASRAGAGGAPVIPTANSPAATVSASPSTTASGSHSASPSASATVAIPSASPSTVVIPQEGEKLIINGFEYFNPHRTIHKGDRHFSIIIPDSDFIGAATIPEINYLISKNRISFSNDKTQEERLHSNPIVISIKIDGKDFKLRRQNAVSEKKEPAAFSGSYQYNGLQQYSATYGIHFLVQENNKLFSNQVYEYSLKAKRPPIGNPESGKHSWRELTLLEIRDLVEPNRELRVLRRPVQRPPPPTAKPSTSQESGTAVAPSQEPGTAVALPTREPIFVQLSSEHTETPSVTPVVNHPNTFSPPKQDIVPKISIPNQLPFNKIPKPNNDDVDVFIKSSNKAANEKIDKTKSGKLQDNNELAVYTVPLAKSNPHAPQKYVTSIRGNFQKLLKYLDWYRLFLYPGSGFLNKLTVHPVNDIKWVNNDGYSTLTVMWTDVTDRPMTPQPAGGIPDFSGLVDYLLFGDKLKFVKKPFPGTDFEYERKLNQVFVRSDNKNYLGIQGTEAANKFVSEFAKDYKEEPVVNQEVDGNFVLVQYADGDTNRIRLNNIIKKFSAFASFQLDRQEDSSDPAYNDFVREKTDEGVNNPEVAVGALNNLKNIIPIDPANLKSANDYVRELRNYNNGTTLLLPSGNGQAFAPGAPVASGNSTRYIGTSSGVSSNQTNIGGLPMLPSTNRSNGGGVLVSTQNGQLMIPVGYVAAQIEHSGLAIGFHHEGNGAVGLYFPNNFTPEQQQKAKEVYGPHLYALNINLQAGNISKPIYYGLLQALLTPNDNYTGKTVDEVLDEEGKKLLGRVANVLVEVASNGTTNATEAVKAHIYTELQSRNGTILNEFNNATSGIRGAILEFNPVTNMTEERIVNYFTYYNYKYSAILKPIYGLTIASGIILGLVYLSMVISKLLYLQTNHDIKGIHTELKVRINNWESEKTTYSNEIERIAKKYSINKEQNQGYKDLMTLFDNAYGEGMKNEINIITNRYDRFHEKYRIGQFKKIEKRLNDSIEELNIKYIERLDMFGAAYQFYIAKTPTGRFNSIRQLQQFIGFFNNQTGSGYRYKRHKTLKYKRKQTNNTSRKYHH